MRLQSMITDDIAFETQPQTRYATLHSLVSARNSPPAHPLPTHMYTDLMNHLTRLEADADTRKMCRRRLLCRTIANNR